MSYPKRADHFKEWAKLMLEQAVVPDRVQYKRQSSTSSKKSVKGMKKRFRKRKKRNRSRLRHLRR